ncbi:hypothetical protein [Massilia glaciei]|nr:hypothetical protein [Massilia glaciei]
MEIGGRAAAAPVHLSGGDLAEQAQAWIGLPVGAKDAAKQDLLVVVPDL